MNEIIFEEVRCAKCKMRLRDLLEAAINRGADMKSFYACGVEGKHEFTQISSSPRVRRRDSDPHFMAAVDHIFEFMCEWSLSLEDVVESATVAALKRQILEHGKIPERF
jgi:hypothetical protein